MMARLVIVCGLPGAGRTTLAKELEASMPAMRMCPDEWMSALGIDLFDGQARERIEQLQWQLTKQLLTLRQNVIIEWGTWARTERDALREGAREVGAAVELRVVDAPTDVLAERIAGRDDQRLTATDLDSYRARFEKPTAEELLLYDDPIG